MAGIGKISNGIAHDSVVERTIQFVRSSLADWRDDPARPKDDAEEALNAQLCKFLNARARDTFPMVSFNHEERQASRRKVDLSATPVSAHPWGSIYTPVLVIEGKRLPSPTNDREQEYVTGFERRSGGIQRFKLSLHGKDLRVAMMIGYVQRGALYEWMQRLNAWVDELSHSDKGDYAWDDSDRLKDYEEHSARTASCRSDHVRPSGDRIRIEHAWVKMG